MHLSVEDWFEEIDIALDYRRVFGREESWQKLEMNYLNDPQSDTVVGSNLIFSEGDTLLSGLLISNPYYVVDPTDSFSVETAPVVEALENSLAKKSKLNIKHHVEISNLHNYLYGKAIIKIGYDSEFGWNPKWDLGTASAPWGMSYTQFNKKGNRIEYANIKPGMPWVSAILPHDIVVPWGSGNDIDSAPWIAHRIIRETKQIKEDPKFKNTSRLTPQISMQDYMNSYIQGPKKIRSHDHRRNKSKPNGRALFNEMWEIHSKDDAKVRVICRTHDRFLRDENDFLQMAIGGYPFVTGSFVNHPRSFWTTPQAYYLGQHQKESFDLSMTAHKQRRINVAKFLMLGDAMSDDELSKLLSGDVGAIAKVKTGTGKKLSDIFMAFPRTSNFDLLAESETIRRNARDAIGQSRNQAGEFDASSRRTASEAVLVSRGAGNRLNRREEVVKHLYLETMRKVMMVIFRFWPQPRDILVNDSWVKFNGAQLRGQYNFDVDLVSLAPMSPPQRKLEVLQLMSYFAQFPNINVAEMQKTILDAVADPRYERIFQDTQSGQLAAPGQGQQSPASGSSTNKVEGRASISAGTRG